MSRLSAVVDQKDLADLEKLFKKIEKLGINVTEKLIDQTIIHAAASAANATRPRKSRNKSGNIRGGKLLDKHKYRPLVPMPSSMGNWYIDKNASRKRPFKIDENLSSGQLRKRGLQRVKKAILVHNKNGKSYIPWYGKRNKKDKRFQIPYAGLAKEAWAKGFKKMGGKGSIPTLRRNRGAGKVYSTKRKFMEAQVSNLVSYVTKSSPGSARYGINRAKNKMKHLYKFKMEKKMQRELNRL